MTALALALGLLLTGVLSLLTGWALSLRHLRKGYAETYRVAADYWQKRSFAEAEMMLGCQGSEDPDTRARSRYWQGVAEISLQHAEWCAAQSLYWEQPLAQLVFSVPPAPLPLTA